MLRIVFDLGDRVELRLGSKEGRPVRGVAALNRLNSWPNRSMGDRSGTAWATPN
jgi:hypothetical protein